MASSSTFDPVDEVLTVHSTYKSASGSNENDARPIHVHKSLLCARSENMRLLIEARRAQRKGGPSDLTLPIGFYALRCYAKLIYGHGDWAELPRQCGDADLFAPCELYEFCVDMDDICDADTTIDEIKSQLIEYRSTYEWPIAAALDVLAKDGLARMMLVDVLSDRQLIGYCYKEYTQSGIAWLSAVDDIDFLKDFTGAAGKRYGVDEYEGGTDDEDKIARQWYVDASCEYHVHAQEGKHWYRVSKPI